MASWSDILNDFKSKRLDMISGISHRDDREAFTLFTKPYYEIPTYLFGLKSDSVYRGVDTLAGKRVGVTKDIFYIDSLQKLGIDSVQLDSSVAKVKALAFGKIDYFLSSFTSARKAIKKLSMTNIKPFDEFTSIKKEDLRFGINIDKSILWSIIEKSLHAICDNEYEQLGNRWILNIVESDARLPELSQDELNYLKQNPIIKAHNEMSWAPYNFNKDGIAKGFSIDYLDLLASKLDIEIEYVSGYSWDEFLGMIKGEKIDVIANIAKSQERAKYIISPQST
jgi:ABC-type amino acid transport substrate-binding protein